MSAPRVEPLDEGTLLARARAGDRGAFAALVREHERDIYTLAVRLTEDYDQAADVAQEAFIRAWNGLPAFRGDSSFGTWMYRITVNTAWTWRRRRRRNQTIDLDGLEAVPPELQYRDDVDEALVLRNRLRAALNELPSGLRTVVVLRDVYGLSHQEIADQLGISAGAAKVRLHRGHRRLQRHLEEHEA
jgi:RNA polymerase sigma-70 factor (ECF subfamily)